MLRTVKAVIDEHGHVRVLEALQLPAARKALVTILEDDPETKISEAALLSEQTRARDWDQPEEEEAWSHLQPRR